MNCWKSLNIIKEYGSKRLIFYSVIFAFAFFNCFYLTYSILFPLTLTQAITWYAIIALLFLVVPVHQLMHCIPLWVSGKKVGLSLSMFILPPRKSFSSSKPLQRNLFILSVLFPFSFITIASLIGAFLYPEYMYGFSMFAALNAGISTVDFLYVMSVRKAPRHAYIENHTDGLNILLSR